MPTVSQIDEPYIESRMSYTDLPLSLRNKYPPSKAKYAGDAIAEREGLLPPSKTALNGYRCAALSKTRQARCGRVAVSGALQCRSHGGTQKKGLASPQYRDGSRSQILPLRLQAQYQAAMADPDLLSLRQDLGVLEVRIQELLQGLDTQESGIAWSRLQELSTKLQGAWEQKQVTLVPGYLSQIQELVTVAVAGAETWGELRALLRDRAQAATLEHKRLQEVQGTIPIEALLALLGHLMERLYTLLQLNLEPGIARQILAQFQQEILAVQKHGLQAPKIKHRAVTTTSQREAGTRRTINLDGSVYVPVTERVPEP